MIQIAATLAGIRRRSGRRCDRRRAFRGCHRVGRSRAAALPAPGRRAPAVAARGAAVRPGRRRARPPATGSSPPRRRRIRSRRRARPPRPAAPALAAARRPRRVPALQTAGVSGTLRDYLQSKGVKLESQKPQGFKALDITLPLPAALDPGARPQRARCVRGDRRPARQQRLHVKRAGRGVQTGRQLRSQGSHHPRLSSTASNCSPGRPPTPRWPTSTASRRRSSRAPTARAT